MSKQAKIVYTEESIQGLLGYSIFREGKRIAATNTYTAAEQICRALNAFEPAREALTGVCFVARLPDMDQFKGEPWIRRAQEAVKLMEPGLPMKTRMAR